MTDTITSGKPRSRSVLSWRRSYAMLARLWRRSLQFRVISTTLVLSGIMLSIVIFGLNESIAERLLDMKLDGASRDIVNARVTVEKQINATDSSTDESLRLNSAISSLSSQSARARQDSTSAGGYTPILLLPGDSGRSGISSSKLIEIPADLKRVVNSNQVAYQYTSIPLDGKMTHVLIIGTPTATSIAELQLYLVYPLDNEERTLSLIRGMMLGAGALLVLMLGVISYAVSHQLVGPLRIASETAERFASGHLEERMIVSGEDDMARLAESFNDMAESLSSQITQLEDLGDLQRQFTSDVSHELRTPLTTVRMAAELIHDQSDNLDTGAARAAELMVKQLDSFETLLSDLLEISRHDAGVAELHLEAMDVRGCAKAALETIQTLADEVGAEIAVDMPDSPVIAHVDSRRVERILRNLLANAIDHSESKPIEFRLRADDYALAFSVRDYGVGLRPGDEKLVFNRFWRADPSRVRHSGGTGLGLSISQDDAELHGGRLEVWGRPGVGASFRLTLPRHQGDRVISSPLPLVPLPKSGRPSQRTLKDRQEGSDGDALNDEMVRRGGSGEDRNAPVFQSGEFSGEFDRGENP